MTLKQHLLQATTCSLWKHCHHWASGILLLLGFSPPQILLLVPSHFTHLFSFYIGLHFIGLQSFSFLLFSLYMLYSMASQVVKNLPANAEDVRDSGLIPGLGRSLKQEMETYSSILA